MTEYSASEHSDPYLAQLNQLSALENADPVHYVEALRALTEKGSLNAMNQLAWAYHHGIGTVVDLTQAERWYRQAGEGGSASALYNLACIYQERGDDQRAYEAISAGAAVNDVRCIHTLGLMYRDGRGVAKDREKARELFGRAVEGGSKEAFHGLASIYWKRKEYKEAYKALAAGAEANDMRCVYWLGRLYRDGQGVERDYHKARTLFERASNQGNLFARSALAILLMSGRCGTRSIVPGLILYLRTVKDGFLTCLKNPDRREQW